MPAFLGHPHAVFDIDQPHVEQPSVPGGRRQETDGAHPHGFTVRQREPQNHVDMPAIASAIRNRAVQCGPVFVQDQCPEVGPGVVQQFGRQS